MWPTKVEIDTEKHEEPLARADVPATRNYTVGKKITGKKKKKRTACKGLAPAMQLDRKGRMSSASLLSTNSLLDEALARINTPHLIESRARLEASRDAHVRDLSPHAQVVGADRM